jgi:hypothetical protein
VSSRSDEVQAGVYSHVELLTSLRLLLLSHEALMLVVLHRLPCQLPSKSTIRRRGHTMKSTMGIQESRLLT